MEGPSGRVKEVTAIGADAQRQPLAFPNCGIARGLDHESGSIREAGVEIGPRPQVLQSFDLPL